jgi:hypothetical protein
MNRIFVTLMALASTSLFASQGSAAGVTFKDGDKYVKFGGRIQLQYHMTDVDGGSSTDKLQFRRMRPYIEGSVHKDWKGKFQWDMGKNDLDLMEAYFEYKGFEGLKVRVGNANFPFSREVLTSSKYQQLVERTFVGDHNYGTLERQAGIHLIGEASEGKITWGASVAKAAHDPDEKKLDFETAISLNKDSDWSDGNLIGARIDFHPLGTLKMSQGDFSKELKATIGVGVFSWSNDNDNLNPRSITHTKKFDLDDATGFEVSAAIRGGGFSFDAQCNVFEADLVDAGVTSGLYLNSQTTLTNYAVEGGYMVVDEIIELVAGYESQDADAYVDSWDRISVGINYFIKKHDIKFQVSYRMNENKDGKIGNDVDELFVQAQYVF